MKRKFQRSDIPYKDRLLMEKHRTIGEQRNNAAQISLQIACVALNDTEGLGYLRLSRFAKRCQELHEDYYKDPEVEDAHLKARLGQLGFIVRDGHIFSVENAKTGEIVSPKVLLGPDVSLQKGEKEHE